MLMCQSDNIMNPTKYVMKFETGCDLYNIESDKTRFPIIICASVIHIFDKIIVSLDHYQ